MLSYPHIPSTSPYLKLEAARINLNLNLNIPAPTAVHERTKTAPHS